MSEPKQIFPVTLSPRIQFFPFSEGGVLFTQGSRRILVLNHAAAVIWCLLDQVQDQEGLTAGLAARFPVDRETARQDTEAALVLFAREGFLGPGPPESLPENDLSGRVAPGPIGEPENWAIKRYFRFAGHGLELASQDSAVCEPYLSLMGHLAVTASVNPQTRLWVLASKDEAGAWDIFLNGRLFAGQRPFESVLPDLLFLTFSRFSQALANRLLFHAAVLAKDGQAVLFPAIAESGKTTLAAALLKNGWRFFSDELALLNRENLTVSPFPLPMSIKPGSVPVLAPDYPGLAKYPVYSRADGKKVRYIIPLAESMVQETDAFPVRELVFPHYRPGASAQKKEIGKAEALRRLAATGSSDRELTSEDVAAMIALVDNRACFELVFSDPAEAVGLFAV